MMDNKDAPAVTINGNCGLTCSQRYPPITGAGNDTNPRLVLNRPNATPLSRCGTALLISD